MKSDVWLSWRGDDEWPSADPFYALSRVAVGLFLLLARTHGVQWWVNITATPSPYQNLSTVISALRGSLGGWGARGFLSQVLVMLLYRRLGDICGKMERLVERFQAGRLVRRGPRLLVSREIVEAEAGLVSCRDQPVLPRRFGWLVRMAAYHAVGYGSQLRAVLETPEMVALLVAAPQAGAILRPLCRMLMVETAVLRPLAAAAEGVSEAGSCEAVGKIARTRVRAPKVAVDWGRIPLPKGIFAITRRQGVRKG